MSNFRNTLALFVAGLLSVNGAAADTTGPVHFDSGMLWGGMKAADLSRFELDNPPPIGDWTVDIVVNDRALGKSVINFRPPQKGKAAPCFTQEQTLLFSLDTQKLSNATVQWLTLKEPSCRPIEELFKGGTTEFDFSTQSLKVSIPQIYLLDVPADYISPSLFDHGITAGRLNYSLSNYISQGNSVGTTAYNYAAMDAGFNYGGWRFRHQGNFTSGGDSPSIYTRLRTYAQTDALNSSAQLTLGEIATNGQIFDSYSIQGMSFDSDPRSIPGSQSAFTPVIEGVAESNAQVVVSQRGTVIYSRTVPPGPFSLKDLSGAGYGADLDVVIIEASGVRHGFSIPFNSSAQLLRPGQFRFISNIGVVDAQSFDKYSPMVGQLSGMYGLSNTLTGYTGVLATSDYHAFSIGSSLSTGVGAITAESSLAHNGLSSGLQDGASFKLAYSTYLELSKTYLNLATYRYSTEGYWSFNDAVATENARRGWLPIYGELNSRPIGANQKSRFDVSLNQGLPEGFGGVYLSGSKINYWQNSARTTSYQFGYANNWQHLSYNLNVSQNLYWNPGSNLQANKFTAYTLNFSFPLGDSGQKSISSNIQKTDTGSAVQTGLTGIAGDQQEIGYGLYGSRSTPDSGATYNNISANGNYSMGNGSANASVSAGDTYRQYSLGFNGGLLAHEEGITLSQTLGETVALLRAPNAGGASITSAPGATVANSGFGVIPSLSPYRRNRVELDPKGMPFNFELAESSTEVVPAAGAIVAVELSAIQRAEPFLIELKYADGRPLPFGSEVIDQKTGKIIGNIGQRGRALVTDLGESGVLQINIRKPEEKCSFNYVRHGGGLPDNTQPFGSAEIISQECNGASLVKGGGTDDDSKS